MEDALNLSDLEFFIKDWLLDCECRQHTQATLGWRRRATGKLLWFLQTNGHEWCGTSELRGFLSYLTRGHQEGGGRWGNARFNRPVSARTVKDYHGCLRALFNWMVNDGVIETSPMARIASPIHRPDQVQPFTHEQVLALLEAARRSREALRNEAILLLALDVGLRASELCQLCVKDIDINNRMCRVLGKGNKHRTLYFGRTTAKALWRYLREEERQPEDPVFCSFFGRRQPMDRNGFRLLMRRLGQVAQIRVVRCSPHTLRHTFAISFLRAGGNIWSLKEILGHTQLHQSLLYAAVSEADVEAQQRMFSPADRFTQSRRASQ
jgi:site-specific recombinase XerD